MAGYNPASNLQAQLPQSTVKYYDKAFIENLKQQTPFVRVSERRDLPPNAGNQLVLFEYNVFAANTVQTTEGNVPSGIATSLVSNTSTIGQLADIKLFLIGSNPVMGMRRKLWHRERLNERAPKGDAIVRTYRNKNCKSLAEMTKPLR